jgi:hypothetical protein
MLPFKQYILNEKLDVDTFIDTTVKKLSKVFKRSLENSSSPHAERIRIGIRKAAYMCIAMDPTIIIDDEYYDMYNIEIDHFMQLDTFHKIDYSQDLVRHRLRLIRAMSEDSPGKIFKSGGIYSQFASKALIYKLNTIIDLDIDTSWTIEDALNDPVTQQSLITSVERFVSEDAYNIACRIWTYDSIKATLDQRYRDINKFKSFSALDMVVANYEIEPNKDTTSKLESSDFDIIDGEFDFDEQECSNIFACTYNNHKAAVFFGQGTAWCTALDYPKWYNRYTQDGSQIYYMESNGVQYQWHLVTDQLMDINDHYARPTTFDETNKELYSRVSSYIEENGSPPDKYMIALYSNKLSLHEGATLGVELYATFPEELQTIITKGTHTAFRALVADVSFAMRGGCADSKVNAIKHALLQKDESYDEIILQMCAIYILGYAGHNFKAEDGYIPPIFEKINRNILTYEDTAAKVITSIYPTILEDLKKYMESIVKQYE